MRQAGASEWASPTAPVERLPEGDQLPTTPVVQNDVEVRPRAGPRPSLFGRARPVAFPIAAYAISRAVTLLGALLATYLRPATAINPNLTTIGGVLSAWDGEWYISLALGGYPHSVPPGNFYAGTGAAAQNGLGFFPLYPLSVRGLHELLPFSAEVDALVISMLCGLAATLVLWRFTSELAGREAADTAALLFCFFPGSVILSFAYSEAMMILLAVACLYLLHRRWWIWAGLAAALAGATRSTGLLLVLCCAWAAGEAIVRRREWRSLAAPVLAPLGGVIFFAYLRFHTGSWTVWFDAERRGWGHRTDWGHGSIHTLHEWVLKPFSDPQVVLIASTTILIVVGLALLVRARLTVPLWIFTLGVLAISFISPDLQLKPRFLFTAFPLFIAAGVVLSRRVGEVVGMFFAGGLGLLTVLYGLMFTLPQPLFP